MKVLIQSIDQYRIYLSTQISKHVKRQRNRDYYTEEMQKAFLDGVKFGRGKLEVDIET